MENRLRIGTGIDAHGFEDGRELIIGGIKLNHPRGLAGHSDADVLIHAIVDALLGACGKGDIGVHFPSSDPRWKGKSSMEFLTWTRDELKRSGIRILSIDSVIVAQEPVMRPYIEPMREKMARALDIETSRLAVKATSTDHLGFVGRKEGIACQAVALVLLP